MKITFFLEKRDLVSELGVFLLGEDVLMNLRFKKMTFVEAF